MAGSESAQSCHSVYPVFGSCIFGSTLHCETIGVLCDLFLLNPFSCRILLTCRRALVGLQIDECNIAGRHHQCVTAIPLACGNLPEAHRHFVR